MKKVLFTMIAALVCLSASAQKGRFGVGLNLNYSPCIEKHVDINNFGISGKLQYNFTDAFRGELQAGYDFKDKELGLFHAAGNLHYLINITDRFRFYPLAGLGYGRLSTDVNKLLVNAGVGMECDVATNLALGLEVKYQYMEDFSRVPISLGITYKF